MEASMPKSNAVRILTDTTAVLPSEYIKAHALEVIPQVIIFGQESYLEDYEISYSEFIHQLKISSDLPKTAAPPIGEAVKALERLTSEAETVICIHPSTELSGTVRTVETAKEEAFPDADIRIIDTRVIGGNLASMVIKANEWAESGMEADEIIQRLRSLIPRARTYFMVDTLEFLHRGGRIGGASSLLGSALRIKPILHLTEGRIDVLEKVRTRHRAIERLIELVVAEIQNAEESLLCVMHAEALDHAQHLVEVFRQTFEIDKIPVYPLGAAITTHAGPGTLGVGFFT
jgi:DegV family protein with EDD domain